MAMPFFARPGALSVTTRPLFFPPSKAPFELVAVVFPSFGNNCLFDPRPCLSSSASLLEVGLHFGQSHLPEGSSVNGTHSIWYHPTGQSSPSQQIQSSDASGSPQVHLQTASAKDNVPDSDLSAFDLDGGGIGGGICFGRGACPWGGMLNSVRLNCPKAEKLTV